MIRVAKVDNILTFFCCGAKEDDSEIDYHQSRKPDTRETDDIFTGLIRVTEEDLQRPFPRRREQPVGLDSLAEPPISVHIELNQLPSRPSNSVLVDKTNRPSPRSTRSSHRAPAVPAPAVLRPPPYSASVATTNRSYHRSFVSSPYSAYSRGTGNVEGRRNPSSRPRHNTTWEVLTPGAAARR